MLKWGIFSVLSVLLVVHTLIRPHQHRFFRLVVFECILALVVLNIGYWFRVPFSFSQVISWMVLILSMWLAVHGFSLLRRAGAPSGDIEDTTRLVTVGAYRYIRHPLYTSLLLLGVGIFLKHVTLLAGVIFLIVVVFLFATAKVEEQENLVKFGEQYREYMAHTKRFIPFII